MKKIYKLILATSYFLTSISNPALTKLDELYNAIHSVDYEKVETLIATNGFTKKDKKNLLEAADVRIKLCITSTTSIFNSQKDLLQIAQGAGLLMASLGVFKYFLDPWVRAPMNRSTIQAIAFAIILGIDGGCAFAGTVVVLATLFLKPQAHRQLIEAMKIKRLIREIVT